MNPLPSLLRATSIDEGDRAMVAAGRTVWSADDAATAAAWLAGRIQVHYRLPTDADESQAAVRFQLARELEDAGEISVYTRWPRAMERIEALLARAAEAMPA